jgi:hypothetical protein
MPKRGLESRLDNNKRHNYQSFTEQWKKETLILSNQLTQCIPGGEPFTAVLRSHADDARGDIHRLSL